MFQSRTVTAIAWIFKIKDQYIVGNASKLAKVKLQVSIKPEGIYFTDFITIQINRTLLFPA